MNEMDRDGREMSIKETMKRYPVLTAHIIAESMGYATPTCAARILKDAREGRENYCEWIYSCYKGDAQMAVKNSILFRGEHNGYMNDYQRARALVKKSLESGEEPLLGSWF